MKIVLLEFPTLLRTGIRRLIDKLDLPAHVIDLDLRRMDAFLYFRCDVDLVILAVPADWSAARDLTAVARERLSPKRILLLCPPENAWSAVGAECDEVYGCLPTDALPEAVEAAIRFGLDLTPRASAMRVSCTTTECLPEPWDTAPSLPAATLTAPLRAAPTFATSVQTQCPVDARADTPISEAEQLGLTPRQYDMLAWFARGYSLKSAARELGISPATARAHAASLYLRLGVGSKGEAVYAARNLGARLETAC